MPLEITELDALDPTLVEQSLAQTAQRVQEANPTLDLKRGVFHDLLVYLHALLDSQLRGGVINRYLSARSLLDIQADPTLADPLVVERVLSNFRLSRGEGAAATGEVTIVINRPISVTVGSGAVFVANGRRFSANSAFTAKPEAAQINGPTDRLLTRLNDGNYAFTIDVTAADEGTESLIAKNTLVVPVAQPNGYVTSYATSDFSGGLNPETNTELLERLQLGVSCKAPSNRPNMQAMLRDQAEFSRVVHSSIVGHGDEEMLRDQHTIFPVSLGGRADWYVRTVERVQRMTLKKTATLVSVGDDGTGVWAFGLTRDDAPGFYEVASVLRPEAENVAGTLPITSDVRGVDLTGDGFVPDVETVAEGAYTRYQTASVRFHDVATDHGALTPGATREYDVTVTALPLVGLIHDYVTDFEVRSYGSDLLVKAPIPCFLKVQFRVAKNRKQADPDVLAIADAVARAANTTGFTGRLYAGHLQDVIAGYLQDGMSVGSIDMFGRIRHPDGTSSYVRGDEVLVIPSVDGAMVSPRTVQFFLDPADVEIQVSTEIPVPQ